MTLTIVLACLGLYLALGATVAYLFREALAGERDRGDIVDLIGIGFVICGTIVVWPIFLTLGLFGYLCARALGTKSVDKSRPGAKPSRR